VLVQGNGQNALLEQRFPSGASKSTSVRGLVRFAATVEAVVGVILMVSPPLVAQLLLGAPLGLPGIALGRVAGFGLFALGLACWPPDAGLNSLPTRGLLAYNILAAAFFLWLGIRGELLGILLWPAFALHATLSVLLARVLLATRSAARRLEN
jgi:hypothetical protein